MGNQVNKKEETMRGKYLNPKADLTFKKIFGEHPNLVISLLNALLPLKEDERIESIEYWPAEKIPRRTQAEKDSIVDVDLSRKTFRSAGTTSPRTSVLAQRSRSATTSSITLTTTSRSSSTPPLRPSGTSE